MFSFSKGGFPKGVLVTPNLNESYCILKNNLNIGVLHGDLMQSEREKMIRMFKKIKIV